MSVKIKFTSTVDEENNHLKMLILGFAGSGKTYGAGMLPGQPSRRLIISCESGLRTIKDNFPEQKIPVWDLTRDETGKTIEDPAARLQRLAQIYDYLNTPTIEKPFDHVFIDSITEIAEIVLAVVQREFPDRKDSFPMWGEYSKRMRAIVKRFRDLHGYNVIMTCLAEVDKDENNKRFIGCDVVGKIGKQLPQFFDEVLYAFVSPEGQFKYYTKKTESLPSKDRSGKLDAEIVADLGAVMTKILGTKKEGKKDV